MQTSTVLNKILEPIDRLFSSNIHAYKCPNFTDEEFISLGVRRVLGSDKSGTEFLQRMRLEGVADINKSDLFDSLKSSRRLNHLKYLNEELNTIANELLAKNDVFAQFKELDAFDIYASDGSYYKWASHDEKFIKSAEKEKKKKDEDPRNDERKDNLEGTKRSCQHFYSCNLRSMIMLHLTVALIGNDAQVDEEERNKKINKNLKKGGKEVEKKAKEKEHDMHALKRLTTDELRFKAKKTRKVLHIYDRAGHDYHQWNNWKQSAGIYFLSREKSNSKLSTIGLPNFDREDLINAGIESNGLITNGNGYPIRRITFVCPETGQRFRFLTNLPDSISPGLIAFLYKARWDVEKQFDVFKNKLEEKKAWASSKTAKTMQAEFICLANNLALLLNDKVETEDKVVYEYDRVRKTKRLNLKEEKIRKKKLIMPTTWRLCLRTSQLPIKFFRWIRTSLYLNTSWEVAIKNLAMLYAMN